MKSSLILFLAIPWMSSSCFHPKPEVTGLEGKPMPSFSLLLTDSTTKLNSLNIPKGKNTILFFFSPHCPFCQAQTEDIVSNITDFTNSQFYLLSTFPLREIRGYTAKYNLTQYKNIVLGQDFNAFFVNYFKVTGVPYIAIYNPQNKLKRAFSGKISTDVIKALTEE